VRECHPKAVGANRPRLTAEESDEGLARLGRERPEHEPDEREQKQREDGGDARAEARLSADGPIFVIEYDGEKVGVIADGDADASLRDGLLAEWRKPADEP
jgi:hypothetical protein